MSVVSPTDFEHYTLGYEQGYADGINRGYELSDLEEHNRWQNMRAFIRARANNLPYDQLAERRGEPDKAQRQRDILKENGVEA